MILKYVLQAGNERVSCTVIHVHKKISSHLRRASVTLAPVHVRKQKGRNCCVRFESASAHRIRLLVEARYACERMIARVCARTMRRGQGTGA